MKAVVVERPHEVAWVEVETPVPGPDDVLVRSRAAGVCRTDIEMVIGRLTDPRWVRFPLVPGHEWSGTIAEVGEGVADLAPGDRVVCEGMIPCNRCVRCKAGDTQLCENYDQLGFTRGGGYGEYVLAPRHVVHRLPDAVSFGAGVLVEPASCRPAGARARRAAAGRDDRRDRHRHTRLAGRHVRAAARARARSSPTASAPEELGFAERLGADAAVHVGERTRSRRRTACWAAGSTS